jgi:DNA-binding transcriptional LysR family regulator
VGENRVVVAARAGHPLAGRGALSPEDVARQPWIVPLRHDPLRAKLETLFARHNLEPPAVLAEASALLFMLAYLRGSDALVYLPERVLLSSGGMADFAILPVPAFDWRPQALIVRRRGATLSPAVRTHIRLLKEAVLEPAVVT